MPELFTTGQIAEELSQPLWRVAYFLRSRGIEPLRRVGNVRVFDRAAVNRIREEISQRQTR